MSKKYLKIEDITDEKMNSLRKVRNETGFQFNDLELAKFHIEWENIRLYLGKGENKNA